MYQEYGNVRDLATASAKREFDNIPNVWVANPKSHSSQNGTTKSLRSISA
jgi:hypothetical protein